MTDERVERRSGKPPPCPGCGYDGDESHCCRCHATGMDELGDIWEHLTSHGYKIPTWPDGGLAYVDTTLTPDRFSSGAG